MRLSSALRAALIAVTALIGAGLSSAAYADSGRVSFTVLKGGWFIGGSGGSGTLTFRGRSYPLAIGGVSAGLVFGGSQTRYHGTVSNIRSRFLACSGVYGAVGAGGAVGVGAQVISLRNEKGAVLNLPAGRSALQLNADVSGLTITVR